MTKELEEVFRMISRTLERDVSLYEESFLMKSLEKRMEKTATKTPGSYLGYLSENREEAETFFRSLNITYSEFFRSPLTFALLEQIILPRLIEEKAKSNRSEIRIWSAGCAAGQESYSIAMLLDEIAAKRDIEIPFRIFATDTSEPDLASARIGVYDYGTLQNVRLKHLRTYFTTQGEAYVIDAGLRDRIEFSYYDLLDDESACPPTSIFGDFDLVMCCNLLFYYRQDIRRFILSKVGRCLSQEGYLVTGEVERVIVERTEGFHTVAVPTAALQLSMRKR
jgi:chemotaxis methyl-accepting protein methylase